ncbi:DegT/DnrJ/EryC1/StrS aminotransferase family protein [Lusitaniella coriacea LEGE 07157]|uniref:DegT/DnrJ/EryC1/StrS aminotransferase family protein n=1 Tax=Lusitaniella coriacea LEGE 07157 TaxID=945747 RepID=A0A8J7DYD0_9CYAN|nr:DegT/DnrJ/EryC1/StrS aminotransferase family protein [Lusitaniella coriacea]MBE9117395.1 DegT/DnrJ/EryC1/StrS aminotransferase family protein [Lusitaniella coriacea LEGE 07157]
MTSTPVKIPFVDLSLQHQPIQEQIEQAMQTVARKGNFILGQELAEFEQAFATACGVEYGIGVACGTDAIAIGLHACGIGEGDEVLIPANTFIATLIGVLRANATPILVDCDPDTALIDLEAAEKAISPKTKAILPVHLYGQVVSPSQLQDFAQKHNLIIFEDAAQAHLAEREGHRAGSIGTAAAFSFYPSKNLGAFGDGGIIVTRDEKVAKIARSYRNYGCSTKYVHVEAGTNSRLDTLQAAVLKVKLPHLHGWNQSRNQAAQYYDRALASLKEKGIISLENQCGNSHIYHLYVVRINSPCSLKREDIQGKLAEEGIQTGIHYPIPCHLQPAYQFLGYNTGDFPNAEMLAQEIVSLPMYPGLNEAQVQQVVEALARIIG